MQSTPPYVNVDPYDLTNLKMVILFYHFQISASKTHTPNAEAGTREP